jgi:hypothetical protein
VPVSIVQEAGWVRKIWPPSGFNPRTVELYEIGTRWLVAVICEETDADRRSQDAVAESRKCPLFHFTAFRQKVGNVKLLSCIRALYLALPYDYSCDTSFPVIVNCYRRSSRNSCPPPPPPPPAFRISAGPLRTYRRGILYRIALFATVGCCVIVISVHITRF